MSQKPSRFSRNRKLRADTSFNEYHKPRRPILFSSNDVERMAVERSRAKLIRQLVSKPQDTNGEFSSYFCGENQLIDPVYSATTHAVNDHELRHPSVISTYPMMNNVRWHPSTHESTSVYNCQLNERQNDEEPTRRICRCKECTVKHCRGKPKPEYKPREFRDNIIRFVDNYTMTPKLNDACCGSYTIVPSRKTSDASVSSSDAAVKENPHPMSSISQVYVNCDPVSILKKKKYDNILNYKVDDEDFGAQTDRRCRIADHDYQEAVRDTEDDVYEPNDSKPLRSFPKVVRNKPPDYLFDKEPRKNIYNEGISDLTLTLLPTAPVHPERHGTVKSLSPGYSRTSFLRKATQRSDDMPFSQYTESKYHHSCRTPQIRTYFCSNDIEQDASNRKFKKTYISKPMPFYKNDSVKYPRKMLTSERDIDSYVGGQSMKVYQR